MTGAPSSALSIPGQDAGRSAGAIIRGAMRPVSVCGVPRVLAIAGMAAYVAAQVLFRFGMLGTAQQLRAVDARAMLELAGIGCCVVSLVIRDSLLSRTQTVLLSSSVALLAMSAGRTGNYDLAYGLVVIAAIADVDLGDLLRAYVVTSLASIVLLMALSSIGLLENKDVIPNSRLVFSYGTIHPNSVGALIFNSLAAMSFVCWEGRRWYLPIPLAIAAAAFSYAMLSAHAGCLLDVLLVLVVIVGHSGAVSRLRAHQVPGRLVLILVPLSAMIVMLAAAAFYSNDCQPWVWFDRFIHGRPHHANAYFAESGGFTLLGRRLEVVDNYRSGMAFQNVDSGYCYLALVTGLLPMLAVALVYLRSVPSLVRGGAWFFVLCSVVMGALFLMVECLDLYLASSYVAVFVSRAFSTSSLARQGRGGIG